MYQFRYLTILFFSLNIFLIMGFDQYRKCGFENDTIYGIGIEQKINENLYYENFSKYSPYGYLTIPFIYFLFIRRI